jgi:hypothetical protein
MVLNKQNFKNIFKFLRLANILLAKLSINFIGFVEAFVIRFRRGELLTYLSEKKQDYCFALQISMYKMPGIQM